MDKKKARKIFIPLGIILVIAGLLAIYYFNRKVPTNPTEAVGNTAGNLLNGGTFCEYDGTIYFANPYDNDYLYSMTSDCQNIKRINDDSVSYINAYGKYMYYIRNNGDGSASSALFRGQLYGVVRSKLNGSSEKTLYTGYCTDLKMVANTLVFNANNDSVLSTMAMSLEGGTPDLLYAGDISNGSALGDFVYYSNNEANHCVYMLNLSTGSRTMYLEGNTYMVGITDNILYYIDLDNNNALTAVNLNTLSKTVLTKDKVVNYNVYGNVIFYQCEDTSSYHALKRMNLDGSNAVEILKGDITNISCTSGYTFFKLYGEENLYRVATQGGTTVERFTIAPE